MSKLVTTSSDSKSLNESDLVRSNFFRPICNFLILFFVAMSADLATPFADSAQSISFKALTDSDIEQRAVGLRQDLETVYQDLKSRGALTNDNDVKATVIKYVPIGTSFDDAEAILRATGFLVGSPAQHHDVSTLPYPERMRLSAVDASLPMNHGLSDTGRKLVIQLFPPTPTDYTVVDRLEASIIKQYL